MNASIIAIGSEMLGPTRVDTNSLKITAALEARIASAERERERNELLLCSEEIYRDGERMKKIQAQNADLKAMIELLYAKWEALSKEREELLAAAVES